MNELSVAVLEAESGMGAAFVTRGANLSNDLKFELEKPAFTLKRPALSRSISTVRSVRPVLKKTLLTPSKPRIREDKSISATSTKFKHEAFIKPPSPRVLPIDKIKPHVEMVKPYVKPIKPPMPIDKIKPTIEMVKPHVKPIKPANPKVTPTEELVKPAIEPVDSVVNVTSTPGAQEKANIGKVVAIALIIATAGYGVKKFVLDKPKGDSMNGPKLKNKSTSPKNKSKTTRKGNYKQSIEIK